MKPIHRAFIFYSLGGFLLISFILITVIAYVLKVQLLISHLLLFISLVYGGGYLLYALINDKPLRVNVDPVSFFFLSFVLISAISTTFVIPISALANHYIHELICCGLLYIVVISLFRKDHRIVETFFITNLLVALVFMGQYWYIRIYSGSIYEFIGFFKMKHFLAIYLIISLALSFDIKAVNKYILTVIVLLTTATVIDTGSRISIVSLFAAGLTYGALHRFKTLKLSYIAPLIILLGALTYALYQLRPESVEGRFLLWKIGLSGMEWKYALLGRGLGFYRILSGRPSGRCNGP